MSTVTIAIDGRRCQAEEKEPVLVVAKRAGIEIPALCYHEALDPYGACRLCMVEVVAGGRPGMTTSCTLAANDGLDVKTDTPEIRQIRKGLLELYLAQAPDSDYIRELAAQHGVTASRFAPKADPDAPEEKCVLCGLCVRVCNEAIGAGVINFIGRGPETNVNSPYLEPSDKCIGCTACADVCPTDVIKITDRNGTRIVETWSQTEVLIKQCRICGRDCAPEPLIDAVYKGAPDLAEELKDVCPKCRRRLKTRKLPHMTR
jgi:NADH dehydrogenase/NADH:ubiquinone oxidoreductase subunit G